MKRFLVVGAGSIGVRHIRCLIHLGYNSIAALRTKKGSSKELPKELGPSVTELFSWNEVIDWEPTHMIVSNPTSLHLDTVLKGIENKYEILVEKPFVDSYNLLNSNPIFNKISSYNNGRVAYNLRFNSVFKFLKNVVESCVYGDVKRGELVVGHYLPFWHPNEDYRESYAAKKELGGGVLRTLSHELDLSQFLFGSFKKVFSKVSKVSELEIDVDDTVDIVLECKNCNNIYIHLDYLNPIPIREGRLFMAQGLIKYDYFKKEVNFTSYATKQNELIFSGTDDYDSQYVNQLLDFINKGNTGCNFREGLMVDKLIESCEKSSKENQSICLD
jgi:predicted dehydrogenase